MSRVLIGIPTFNRPGFVRDAVASVAAQTFTDWSALVSDNASEPPTRKVIGEYVTRLGDPRVSFHQQETNLGEYGQGKTFLARARELGCAYFAILHDDDVMEPGFLEAGVAALDRHEDMALFACNPYVMTADRARNDELTRDFHHRSQRDGVPRGPYDVLSTHMACGFTPISGALFRVAALEASGFVDDDLYGCVPFENNIFVRLGERGAKGWFEPDQLLGFRSHSQQMQKTDYLNNQDYVRLTIRMLERRRFEGVNERRRRQALGRLYRIQAVADVRAGDYRGARAKAARAIRTNPVSVSTMLFTTAVYVAPYLARKAADAWGAGAGEAAPPAAAR